MRPRSASATSRLSAFATIGPPVLFFLASLGLQLWQPLPWDADTAYHAAVGNMIHKHGILHAFPWTPFSILADRYADKELLFHLMFAPLSGFDWVTAARIVGTLSGFTVLMVIWTVLRARRIRRSCLLALLPLATSSLFAFRFALVRPHVLAIALALLTVFCATERKRAALFLVCVAYPLTYVGWHLALLLVVLVEGVHLAAEGRIAWKNVGTALAGLLAGVLIHPNFPNILRVAWIQNVTILMETAWGNREGFALGAEFQPIGMTAFIRGGGLAALVATIAALAAARRRWRDEPLLLAYAAGALGFCCLTLRTFRFIEYLVPFAAMAVALATRRCRNAFLAPAVFGGFLVCTILGGLTPVRAMHYRVPDISPSMRATLRREVPEGAQVFTCSYLFTGEMMLALPERRFIVALDPVFFFAKSPELYRRWYDLVHAPPEDPVERVKTLFGAEWILVERTLDEYADFLAAVSRDPMAEPVAFDDLYVLFRVR